MAPAPAEGGHAVIVDPINFGERWAVQRITIAATPNTPVAAPGARFAAYYNLGTSRQGFGPLAGNLFDSTFSADSPFGYTYAPNGPLYYNAGDQLVIVSSGLVTAGNLVDLKVTIAGIRSYH